MGKIRKENKQFSVGDPLPSADWFNSVNKLIDPTNIEVVGATGCVNSLGATYTIKQRRTPVRRPASTNVCVLGDMVSGTNDDTVALRAGLANGQPVGKGHGVLDNITPVAYRFLVLTGYMKLEIYNNVVVRSEYQLHNLSHAVVENLTPNPIADPSNDTYTFQIPLGWWYDGNAGTGKPRLPKWMPIGCGDIDLHYSHALASPYIRRRSEDITLKVPRMKKVDPNLMYNDDGQVLPRSRRDASNKDLTDKDYDLKDGKI